MSQSRNWTDQASFAFSQNLAFKQAHWSRASPESKVILPNKINYNILRPITWYVFLQSPRELQWMNPTLPCNNTCPCPPHCRNHRESSSFGSFPHLGSVEGSGTHLPGMASVDRTPPTHLEKAVKQVKFTTRQSRMETPGMQRQTRQRMASFRAEKRTVNLSPSCGLRQ